MDTKDIISAVQAKRIRITDHADEGAEADPLTFDEVFFSVFHGEGIENYPNDTPFSSCLIYRRIFSGDPVHSVWAFNEQNQYAVLIPVYRPDRNRWINWRVRKKK